MSLGQRVAAVDRAHSKAAILLIRVHSNVDIYE